MARKRSGIDWRTCPRCGARPVKKYGLAWCNPCGQEIQRLSPKHLPSMRDQLDKEFEQERTIPTPGRLNREVR